MCKQQWKIEAGDQVRLHDTYPGEHWSCITMDCCERDMIAVLFSRTIFDNGAEYMTDWWPDGLPTGWVYLKKFNQVITAWGVLADTTPRYAVLIGEITPEMGEGIVAKRKQLA